MTDLEWSKMFPAYQLVTDELVWIDQEGWQYRVMIDGTTFWFSWTHETERNPDFKRRFELLSIHRQQFAERCREIFSPDRWF